jgi:quinolinate synthase
MLFEQEVNRVGYLSRSVPDREHLVEAILALKKEKNAIILAHYYVSEDIQKIADYIGDSYALAKISKELDTKMIVFCNVL